MITSTACRPSASTRSDEPVERSNFEVHAYVKTRSLALERSIEQQGRVIDERRWGSGSFAFAGQTAVDHPAAFRWHASSKKNRPSWCLFPFRMAMVLPLRTAWIADILSQASLRDVERQRCWKRGSGDAQRLWDYSYFTARLSDLSMPLTSEVRRSPEPSARPSAAADSEERQICMTCLFAESVGFCLCFLPSCMRDVQRQRCSKRGSGDGQRLSLYDYGTTERSFHAVERWGSTLTCTVCTAADSEERQICTTCLFAESVGLWKRRRSYLYVCFLMYAFCHRDREAHFCLRGGWGKRGDLTWHPAVKHQRPAAKTTNSNCCDRAAAQVK